MNQWWFSLSTKQKKQLARRTRTAMRSGASQAAATGAAAQTMGYQAPAAAASSTTQAPAAPSYAAITYRPPSSKKATQAQAGRSPVRGAKDSEKSTKTKLSSLRIKRDRKKKTQKKEGLTAASSSGTGLNIGGY